MLAKIFMAGGISIFGDNPVGWRITPILFGVLAIFIFYAICKQLCHSENIDNTNKPEGISDARANRSWFSMATFVPVFATFLFAFENLSFDNASIGMLDVFYVTFMLAGFLFYLRGNYLSSGFVMGLSLLCKTTAALGIMCILLHLAITRRHEIIAGIRNIFSKNKLPAFDQSALTAFVKIIAPAIGMWIVLLPLLEFPASYQFLNPFSRTLYIFKYHIEFNAVNFHTPEIVTKPWAWLIHPTSIVLNPNPNAPILVNNHFVLDFSPANPLYWSAVSWHIWVLITIAILFLVYEVIKYRSNKHSIATFVLAWFFCVYVMLFPIELISNRLMYIFYFYPAIPAVCLAIAWSTWKLWLYVKNKRVSRIIFLCSLAIYVTGTAVVFFFMSPFGGHFLFHA